MGRFTETLQARFKKMSPGTKASIDTVEARLEGAVEKRGRFLRWTDGGEPEVVGLDKETGEIIFYDCSVESRPAAEVFVTTARARIKKRTPRPK
jgi:hypothetical protein